MNKLPSGSEQSAPSPSPDYRKRSHGPVDEFGKVETTERSRHVYTVKFFRQEKGFGLIMPDNGGPDVLVQTSAVGFGASLTDGQKVSHDVGQDRKTGKSKAENVTVL